MHNHFAAYATPVEKHRLIDWDFKMINLKVSPGETLNFVENWIYKISICKECTSGKLGSGPRSSLCPFNISFEVAIKTLRAVHLIQVCPGPTPAPTKPTHSPPTFVCSVAVQSRRMTSLTFALKPLV